MHVFETDLELLQNTADTRFGGDVEAMGRALVLLEERVEGRDSHFYRKVGNNCIIWSYCDQTIRACEENPDKLQGVFVTNFGTIIRPGAIVIGSVLSGSSEICTDAKIRNSSVAYTRYIAGSTITESRVSMGPVSGSVIDRSFVSANIHGSQLTECVGTVGRINHEKRRQVHMHNDPTKDIEDNGAGATKLLADYGIRLAPGWTAPAK